MSKSQDQFIRRKYNNDKQMEKDLNRLAALGYQPVGDPTVESRIGCMRRILGGFFFARPKITYKVTYQLIPEVVSDDND